MADTQVCPYGDDNKMHMVGHTNKCITLNIWKFIFQFNRPSFYHFPCLIQSHFTIKRLTEQTSTILGADRNEIRPSLRIIVPPQPNGAAVMNSRVKYHVVYSSVFIAVAGAESRRGEPVCSPCPHTHGLWHRAGVWGTRADTQVCPYGLAVHVRSTIRRGEPVCSPCPHTHGLWHRAGVWGTRADTQVCPYGLAVHVRSTIRRGEPVCSPCPHTSTGFVK